VGKSMEGGCLVDLSWLRLPTVERFSACLPATFQGGRGAAEGIVTVQRPGTLVSQLADEYARDSKYGGCVVVCACVMCSVNVRD
jgi:hypothetical protein